MAARIAGIERQTHYNWLASDPAYREAFAAAWEESVESLQEEARRRAFDGSDALLIFLLKAAWPEKYVRFEVFGRHGGPSGAVPRNFITAKLAAIGARLRPAETDARPASG